MNSRGDACKTFEINYSGSKHHRICKDAEFFARLIQEAFLLAPLGQTGSAAEVMSEFCGVTARKGALIINYSINDYTRVSFVGLFSGVINWSESLKPNFYCAIKTHNL